MEEELFDLKFGTWGCVCWLRYKQFIVNPSCPSSLGYFKRLRTAVSHGSRPLGLDGTPTSQFVSSAYCLFRRRMRNVLKQKGRRSSPINENAELERSKRSLVRKKQVLRNSSNN